jgi:hypothetical protein
MQWFKVTLSDEDIAALKNSALQDEFDQIFTAFASPMDAAMFCAPEAWIHDYYFSPGAAMIAMSLIDRYGGAKCPPPTKSAVRLLVGHTGSEAISFSTQS